MRKAAAPARAVQVVGDAEQPPAVLVAVVPREVVVVVQPVVRPVRPVRAQDAAVEAQVAVDVALGRHQRLPARTR